jgi:hypothetical protein
VWSAGSHDALDLRRRSRRSQTANANIPCNRSTQRGP